MTHILYFDGKQLALGTTCDDALINEAVTGNMLQVRGKHSPKATKLTELSILINLS